MKQVKQVGEFHKAFGVDVLEFPQFPERGRVELRQRIFQEEVDEMHNAMDKCDLIGMVDGLVDCMYVLIGTAHEFGLHNILELLFDEVHKSNMSKLDENGLPVKRADGKVIKSNRFVTPDLKTIIHAEMSRHIFAK